MIKKYLFCLVWLGVAACRQTLPFSTLVHQTESADALREYLQTHSVDVDAREVGDSEFARGGSNSLFHIDVGNDEDGDYAVEMARVLVQHGADVNARDYDGYTPLLALPGIGAEYLEDRGEVQAAPDMVDFYVSAGADVLARNEAGYNALDLALSHTSYSANPAMVKKLKKMGLKSTLDRELVWCAAWSDVAGVRRLLAAGASPNACSIDGVPALIAAMDLPVMERVHSKEIVEILLEAGADPDSTETGGNNACALSYARWSTSAPPVELARLLLKYGANAKNLPVVDYAGADDDAYVELLRKHGAHILKEKRVGTIR